MKVERNMLYCSRMSSRLHINKLNESSLCQEVNLKDTFKAMRFWKYYDCVILTYPLVLHGEIKAEI